MEAGYFSEINTKMSRRQASDWKPSREFQGTYPGITGNHGRQTQQSWNAYFLTTLEFCESFLTQLCDFNPSNLFFFFLDIFQSTQLYFAYGFSVGYVPANLPVPGQKLAVKHKRLRGHLIGVTKRSQD
jgi:hypothetical protein